MIRSSVTRPPVIRSFALYHKARLAVLSVAILTLSAHPAFGAQEVRPTALANAPAPMTVRDIDDRLHVITDPGIRANIVATISAAGERGLPMEPLVDKALEGIEKGAPAARIELAVRAMAGRLATASTALAPVANPKDLLAGADALGAGVPADILRRIRSFAAGRSTAVALGVTAQLTARGVPAAQAGAAVAALFRGGASPAQLVSLERMVKEDLTAGLHPSTAVDLRTRQLTSALPPTIPVPAASDVEFQGLGAPRTPTTPKRRP